MPASRNHSADAVRGLAIVAVVAGHVNRGAAERLPNTPVMAAVDMVLYAIHLPAFFYLAGYFALSAMRKASLSGYVRGRMRTLAYPYIVWSVIQVVANMAMQHALHVNNTLGLRDLLAIGWAPINVMWFLYALFLCQMLGFALRARPGTLLAITLAAGGAASIAGVMGKADLLPLTIAYLPWFAAGMLVRDRGGAAVPDALGRPVVLAAAGLAFALGCAMALTVWRVSRLEIAFLPVSVAGVIVMAGLAVHLAHLPGAGPLIRRIGRGSLSIYLLHVLVLALAVRMIPLLGFEGYAGRMILGTAAGVFGSLLIDIALQRARLTRWLGLESGGVRTGRAVSTPGSGPVPQAIPAER